MKFGLVSTLALMLILLVFTGSSNGEKQHDASNQDPERFSCPYQTPEEWQEFLENYAGDERWVKTCEDSTCDGEFYQFIDDNIQSIFNRCEKFFREHESIARCTQNMRRFTPFWLKQHDDVSYGFLSDNHTYLAAENAPDKPQDMMKIPDAIVAALPYREKVEEAARNNGLQYLTHTSAIDGFRTFIFIPDPQGRYDKWMLLNLNTGNSKVKEKTQFSILAVQKQDAQGRVLPKVRLHFRDYTIVRDKSQSGYGLALNESGNGKCFSCHSNGVRQLIPTHTPVLEAEPVKGEFVADSRDFAYQRLMQFNRKLRSYGTPDWDGNVIPEDLGPPLGAGQRCTDCHNGTSRAPLTVFTSVSQIEQKTYKELSMPPDTQLPEFIEWRQMNKAALSLKSTRETEATLKEAYGMHAALIKNFESSRLPALKEWFLRTSCR